MSSLEEQFDKEMWELYRRTVRETRVYNPSLFVEMLARKGGLRTAQDLLRDSNPQYGFERLWELGRVDLTVECFVLQPRFQSLFTENELGEARRRIRDLNYDVNPEGALIKFTQTGKLVPP